MTTLSIDVRSAAVRDHTGHAIAITERPYSCADAEWRALAMAWGATIQAAVAAQKVAP